tara:strand:+ start:1841 stop:1990 length:150 start_codon:yes stop_codon:yes gene_type:complete
MPKVTTKDGKTKTFKYTKSGMKKAKSYAKATGSKVSMKGAMKRRVSKGY